jgi:hypothetical protein
MSSIPQIANIKSSTVTENRLPRSEGSSVTFCQVCSWYGYPQEKIIRDFEGIRPEDEDGFIYKFTEYDYNTDTGEKRTKHIHKYNLKLVQESLDIALKMRNDGSCQE